MMDRSNLRSKTESGKKRYSIYIQTNNSVFSK
jgi:hypothetical protein